MTRVGLEGMEFYAFHGYYEAERKIGNTYLLDVFVDLKNELSDSESIHDTVNYEVIYEVSKKVMESPKKLLETVVFKIAHGIKDSFSNIDKVHVKLRKTSVQLGGKLNSSFVEFTL